MHIYILTALLLSPPLISACTNFLIPPSSSKDSSSIITYAADGYMYGAMSQYPGGSHPPGSMQKIYSMGRYMGEIAYIPETYNVIGNMNEYQVCIGETTFGGLEELATQEGAILDYVNLINVALERAGSAGEAVYVIGNLTDTYGYASSGESFSIGDPKEIWHMEIISKGNGYKGAVWVAMKVPEGHVGAHANQARIETFPMDDPETCIYSPDVVSFAKEKGLYPQEAPDHLFSFSGVYNPISFEGARLCDGRVWSFFRGVGDVVIMDSYIDYITGVNLTHRLPLFIRPSTPISIRDVLSLMRNHYEGTILDPTKDIGSEAFHLPYRYSPLLWDYNQKHYFNERPIATQQTAFSIVGQMRGWLPNPVGGIVWFGVDDFASSPHTPMYAGCREVPWRWGYELMGNTTLDAAFWVHNLLSNYAYQRYSQIHPDIEHKISEIEDRFMSEIAHIDSVGKEIYLQNPSKAIEYVTEYSVHTANKLVVDWLKYFGELFIKFMDGNQKSRSGGPIPNVLWPGYGEPWYQIIAKDTGDHYKFPK